ncbi:MAG: flippase-like domain-containing protein [Saprospiraceae bacterium]|jgi:uncharacterized protein (TIRG00374 family)|nr:flippase-like domain-containing protein [Saprospiraceae bacterium]
MKKHLAKSAQILLFFSVGLIILYLVFERQNTAYKAECSLKGIPATECSLLDKIVTDVSSAQMGWVALTITLFMLTNLIRALRWKMMLQAIGYESRLINLVGTIMINYLTNLGIPRSGEVIRAGLVTKYEGIPMEKVLGTIFTDRIFDVIMLVIFILLAVLVGGSEFMGYISQQMGDNVSIINTLENPIWLVGIALPIALIAAVVWWQRNTIRQSRWGRKLSGLIQGFADGVRSVGSVSSLSLFVFYTIAIWIIYYFMFYFAFFSFEPTSHLGPGVALVVFVFGSLGILIPTPGGMGSYHYLVGQGLALYGVAGSDGFSFANIVFFSIQLLANILFGLASLLILPAINKR